EATMVASGTMTNRIDRLVTDGLAQRNVNPKDSRSFLIGLTDKGLALIDEVVTEHVKTQAGLIKGLSADEVETLNVLLGKALVAASDDET
ncbi:MarR family transcriptional regulator, partial [Rhodobacterales bacterium 56_14_T64]